MEPSLSLHARQPKDGRYQEQNSAITKKAVRIDGLRRKMSIRQWIEVFRSSSWSGWPEAAYEKSRYQQRLDAVRAHFRDCLNTAPPGPVRVVSMCAGDGR